MFQGTKLVLSGVCMALVLVPLLSIGSATPAVRCSPLPEAPYIPSQIGHNTTRRQAVIDYLLALYKPEEGTFYAYLRDWPRDPRFRVYPDIFDVYDAFRVMRHLDYVEQFDWSNCTKFLRSLANDESAYDTFGPLNSSRLAQCDVITCDVATDMFPGLGISDALDVDAIVEYIYRAQTPSGGFVVAVWEDREERPNLIGTQSALVALKRLNRLDAIDMQGAIEYVLSCYDGVGFAYAPGFSAEVGATPLGLMCLDYLDAMDRIDRERLISFVLSHFDNASGCATDGGTIVKTERIVWSLYLLDALDRIDQEAVVSWVLACQSTRHGGFRSDPDADDIDERLEYDRAALHILSMLGRLDVLDEWFVVIEYPEHTTPPGYYDAVEEWLERHSSSTAGGWPSLPQVDVIGFLVREGPYIVFSSLVISPAIYICTSDRRRRAELARMKKRRRRPR